MHACQIFLLWPTASTRFQQNIEEPSLIVVPVHTFLLLATGWSTIILSIYPLSKLLMVTLLPWLVKVISRSNCQMVQITQRWFSRMWSMHLTSCSLWYRSPILTRLIAWPCLTEECVWLLYFSCDLALPHFSKFCDQNFKLQLLTHFLMYFLKNWTAHCTIYNLDAWYIINANIDLF